MGTTSDLLRPMSIGDILDGAIRLYRNNFRLLIGIAAWVYIPLFFSVLIIPQMAYWVLSLILSTFLLPAVTNVAISERILNRKTSVIASYRRVGKRLPSLICAMLFVMLIVFGILEWSGIAARFLGVGSIRPMSLSRALEYGLIMLAIMSLALMVMVRLLFTFQAVLLEGMKAIRALARSWDLTKGSFWKITVTLILVYIAGFLINLLFGLLGKTIILVIAGKGSTVWDLIAKTSIINLFLYPFHMAVITLLYYDIRVRKEAYDIELMAEELAIE